MTQPAPRLGCTIGAALIALLASVPALAAETIYGVSQAERCYRFARYGASRDAVETCTEAIRSEALGKRDRAATYSNRGVIRARDGDYELALSDHDRALELHPTSIFGLINRGNTLVRMGRFEAALADYDLAIFYSEQRSAIAYYNRALAYRKLGRKVEAEADLVRALALRPTSRRYRDALASLD